MPRDLLAGRGLPVVGEAERNSTRAPRDLLAGRGLKPVTPAAATLDWSDVPAEAARNFLPSLGQMASDVFQAVSHPIETAKAVGNVGAGLAAKAGIGDADQTAADNLIQFFADRYGGVENLKRTMAQDPAGFLADLGMVLSLGGGAAARTPGVAGQVARAVRTAGDVIDPVAAGVRAGGAALRTAGGLSSHVLGLTTGVGGDAIKEMTRAGRQGNRAALEQLRDNAPVSDIPDSAHRALDVMAAERSAQFETDMAPVRADTTPLSYDDIHDALAEAVRETFHNGKAKDTRAATALMNIRQVVREWQRAGLNTAMDLDALKQRIGEIRDGTEAGTLARRVTDKVYNAARNTIAKQVPEYDVAQRGYQSATELMQELRKELSLTESATANRSARKLLSALRNNVNTNFGARERLMRELAKKEPALPGMIAGREMSGIEPRGLARVLSNPLFGLPASVGAFAVNPWLLALMPPAFAAASPRVVGEAAYAAGRASGALTPTQVRLLGRVAYQADRAREAEEKKKKGR